MAAHGRVVMSDPIRATTRSIQELRNWIIINGQFGPHGTELLECLMHIDELRASRPSASHLEQTTLGIAGTLPPSDQEIEEWADQSDLIPSEELVCDEQWQRCFLPKQFYATIRAALARWGSLAALAVPPPAAAPPPAPVAWCNSDDFLVAAEKRQSFSGWRERHYDCDMALYAAPPPAPMAWPELPDCREEWRTGDCADTEYVGGLRVGYRYARQKLAAMNPNHQPENHQ
jgi:hypothetical protein